MIIAIPTDRAISILKFDTDDQPAVEHFMTNVLPQVTYRLTDKPEGLNRPAVPIGVSKTGYEFSIDLSSQ